MRYFMGFGKVFPPRVSSGVQFRADHYRTPWKHSRSDPSALPDGKRPASVRKEAQNLLVRKPDIQQRQPEIVPDETVHIDAGAPVIAAGLPVIPHKAGGQFLPERKAAVLDPSQAPPEIGPGDENELEALKKSLGKENITLVQPPAGPGGGSRDGDQPRRRKGERGGGAKRVE